MGEVPVPSWGAETLGHLTIADLTGAQSLSDNPPSLLAPPLTTVFDGFDFEDNMTYNGTYFIPADPMGTVGIDMAIAVGNSLIETRDKTGTLLWQDDLDGFFSSL